MNAVTYQHLANLVLALHVCIVLFVVGGLLLIMIGNIKQWHWVNLRWFRYLHLTAILVVIAETWLGWTCPLTTLEMWLRAKAGSTVYPGNFIEHWLQALLYYHAPDWVFLLIYSLFGLLVIAVWLRFPPHADK